VKYHIGWIAVTGTIDPATGVWDETPDGRLECEKNYRLVNEKTKREVKEELDFGLLKICKLFVEAE